MAAVDSIVFQFLTGSDHRPTGGGSNISDQLDTSLVNEVIGQGQSKTISVSFIASSDLTNVTVRVVPEYFHYLCEGQ